MSLVLKSISLPARHWALPNGLQCVVLRLQKWGLQTQQGSVNSSEEIPVPHNCTMEIADQPSWETLETHKFFINANLQTSCLFRADELWKFAEFGSKEVGIGAMRIITLTSAIMTGLRPARNSRANSSSFCHALSSTVKHKIVTQLWGKSEMKKIQLIHLLKAGYQSNQSILEHSLIIMKDNIAPPWIWQTVTGSDNFSALGWEFSYVLIHRKRKGQYIAHKHNNKKDVVTSSTTSIS